MAQQYYVVDSAMLSPDLDFVVVALDLMSGIVQGLGAHAIPLVGNAAEPTIFTLLKMTMKNEVADVRSSSFAMLGDLCGPCFGTVVPHLDEIFGLIVQNLHANDMRSVSAMNNAAWSAGEIAMQYRKLYVLT